MTDISHSDHESRSPRDERRLLLDRAIAEHGTIARLADALGVTTRTIHRWRQHPEWIKSEYLAVLAGEPAPTEALPSDPRTAAMYDLRAEGRSLQEIGDAFGLSRERVRQLLAPFPAAGAANRRARLDEVAARGERAAAEVSAHAGAIDAVFAQVHNDTIVADRFPALDRAALVDYLQVRFPNAARRGAPAVKQWSDDEILASIVAAADEDRVVTGNAYESWRTEVRAQGGDAPSRPTILNRFGTWNAAVEAASCTPGRRRRSEYRRRWTDEAIEAVVQEFVYDQLLAGGSLRWARFAEWLQQRPVDQRPSEALVRQRTGDWVLLVRRLAVDLGASPSAA